MSFNELVSSDMVLRHLTVPAEDAVYVRAILEASDGIAAVFSERGGEMVFAAFPSRLGELDQLIADLRQEFGASIWLAEPASAGHSLARLGLPQEVPSSGD